MSDKPMFSILESFGTRLDKLEKAVIPVHRETKNLQTLQDRFVIFFSTCHQNVDMSPRRTFLKDNIVKVLSAIDNVVSYHNIVKKRQE